MLMFPPLNYEISERERPMAQAAGWLAAGCTLGRRGGARQQKLLGVQLYSYYYSRKGCGTGTCTALYS